MKKDKCPLLLKHRDKFKALQKKGLDGQMAKKPPADTSLYMETSSSAVGNESLPHQACNISNSLLRDVCAYKDGNLQKSKAKTQHI